MKKALCQALVDIAADPDFVFLTGDLGFNALEPLRAALGERFINAGVAEQNMVGAAAGLARGGFQPWVYSIAPFVYARPFEQIRNDVCAQRLPVRLIGNGGGYGYGAQGPTHHALEDCGVLLSLEGMRAFVPAFASDLVSVIAEMRRLAVPAYLRLGRSEEPAGYLPPPYAPWRQLLHGNGATIVSVGPVAGTLIAPLSQMNDSARPSLWLASELPLGELPGQLLEDLRRSQHLVVVEEHVAHGGLGQMLALRLLALGEWVPRFTHRPALRLVTGLHGSQQFHRKECGMDAASIIALVSGGNSRGTPGVQCGTRARGNKTGRT